MLNQSVKAWLKRSQASLGSSPRRVRPQSRETLAALTDLGDAAGLCGALRALGRTPGQSSFAEDPVAAELSRFYFRDGFCLGRKLHF